jgi:hypothetical protein
MVTSTKQTTPRTPATEAIRPELVETGEQRDVEWSFTAASVPVQLAPYTRAKCETQIDNGGAHGDDRHVEIERIGFVKIQRPDFRHEFTGQMLPRPPVALFICKGQGTSSDPGTEAHMISAVRPARSDTPQYPAGSHEKSSAQNPESKSGLAAKERRCAEPAPRTLHMHAETSSEEYAPRLG